MKLQWILFFSICFVGLFTPAQGLFSGTSLQDYVDGLVDAAKFQLQGMLSLNDTTVGRMWSYFKSKYGRVYSSLGMKVLV